MTDGAHSSFERAPAEQLLGDLGASLMALAAAQDAEGVRQLALGYLAAEGLARLQSGGPFPEGFRGRLLEDMDYAARVADAEECLPELSPTLISVVAGFPEGDHIGLATSFFRQVMEYVPPPRRGYSGAL